MKLTKKKIVAAVIAALCVLGVADLTLLENSNLKEVIQKVEGLLDDDAEAPEEEAPAAPAEESAAE